MTTPTTTAVKALRVKVQKRLGVSATGACEHCAEAVHVHKRSWQKWESGEREMKPWMWELAQIKLDADK